MVQTPPDTREEERQRRRRERDKDNLSMERLGVTDCVSVPRIYQCSG